MRLISALTTVAAGLALLFSADPSLAQAPPGLGGTWVWAVEGRPVLVLEVADEAGERTTLTRPGSISLNGDGDVMGVSGPVYTQVLTSAPEAENLHLRYDDPADASSHDYKVRLIDEDRLEFRFDGGPAAGRPLVLYRPRAPTLVETDWGGDRVYGGPVVPAGMSNPELKAWFEADQAARSGGPEGTDWSVVERQDRERRAATRQLMDRGGLMTAEDYWRAAFIFQHGDAADDYMLAHVLAVTAVAKGKPDAAWIAAATLDRYLQTAGKAQIYGTQFAIPHNGDPVTQGDYDRALIPDAARQAVGVPSLAEQEEQRQAYETHRPR